MPDEPINQQHQITVDKEMTVQEIAARWSEKVAHDLKSAQSMREKISELVRINSNLLNACDIGLNALIGCAMPGPGVDDRVAILQAQRVMREAIKLAGTDYEAGETK